MKDVGRFYPSNCTAPKKLLRQWRCARVYQGSHHRCQYASCKAKNLAITFRCTAPLNRALADGQMKEFYLSAHPSRYKQKGWRSRESVGGFIVYKPRSSLARCGFVGAPLALGRSFRKRATRPSFRKRGFRKRSTVTTCT